MIRHYIIRIECDSHRGTSNINISDDSNIIRWQCWDESAKIAWKMFCSYLFNHPDFFVPHAEKKDKCITQDTIKQLEEKVRELESEIAILNTV